LPTLGVDPASSYCFPVNNGFAVGGIRLNLAGREPAGILAAGAAEDFCRQLTEDLLSIVDARTKRPLVRRVLRTADIFRGERLEGLPDLLVEWSDDVPTGTTNAGKGKNALVGARGKKIGRLEGMNHYGRTGEHRPRGLFIATGPGISPGVVNRDVSLFDFAPTFGKLLDVELSAGDGGPIDELLPKFH
jgi:predicted AlkP superfamily phosphohydrolase/phosphomutase